ncbi:uncharacterized protein LOC115784134 isoform X2 [Archocentrus centrarchus]|uniref:uncharacterized protein LOC115784134 isoform X2 n=1 Tax=Archocentrus centrarchus TaxID=63155 RepID=UPI0011E9C4A8|nr:uncharacterized protein LOC115784134 isoform X2 [Archocentrus centrarchus]
MNPFSFIFMSFIIILFRVRQASGCQQINVSCSDIKTPDGFNFKHASSPEGSEVYVYDNGTCTAYASFGNPPSLSLSVEVLRLDNGSVTTKSCRNITILVIIPHGVIQGKALVEETCVHFQAQTKTDPSDSDLLTLSLVTAAVIAGAIVMAWRCFQSRKTGLNSDGEPQRSCEVHEWNDTTESEEVHSIHIIEADANTTQSSSLDRNLSNERLQTTKDGDTGAHNAGRISRHRSMNRNLREDPGGVDSNKGQDISELDTGDAAGNHAEEDETEGQPLLSNQRAASFEMTGEATPLVNKVSFDQDPVSRCCAAPETDVESKKQHEEAT